MNAEMLKILCTQFGIDPAMLDGMLKTAATVGEKIESAEARLAALESSAAAQTALLQKIAARLIPEGGNDD